MNYAASQRPSSFKTGCHSDLINDRIDRERSPRAASIRVLLVEDRPDYQRDACKLLFCWGIVPAIASNGVMAVKFCREQKFDVILMDISMPVMDGLEATMRIRSDELLHPEHPHCPIVAYTAGGTADDRMLWEKIGIDAVLNKPTNLEKMAACLEKWCNPAFDGSARLTG